MAKKAQNLLSHFEIEEAFSHYSAIVNLLDVHDKESLEFAYWIHRERGFCAYFLGLEEVYSWCIRL